MEKGGDPEVVTAGSQLTAGRCGEGWRPRGGHCKEITADGGVGVEQGRDPEEVTAGSQLTAG